MSEIDSQELTEWYAYDQRWPLPDSWQETARICRIVMTSSGNYKKVPDESVFIPSVVKPNQTADQMWAELAKLKQ